jgi:hypothetical protein
MDKQDKERLELPSNSFESLVKEISDFLTEGPMEDADREQRMITRISPKYEIRIQTKSDPIVEETKRYRAMAEEFDGRYDAYMKRVADAHKDEEPD